MSRPSQYWRARLRLTPRRGLCLSRQHRRRRDRRGPGRPSPRARRCRRARGCRTTPPLPPGLRLPSDPDGREWRKPPRSAGAAAATSGGGESAASPASAVGSGTTPAQGGIPAVASADRPPLLGQVTPALPSRQASLAVRSCRALLGPAVVVDYWPLVSDVFRSAHPRDANGAQVVWRAFREFAVAAGYDARPAAERDFGSFIRSVVSSAAWLRYGPAPCGRPTVCRRRRGVRPPRGLALPFAPPPRGPARQLFGARRLRSCGPLARPEPGGPADRAGGSDVGSRRPFARSACEHPPGGARDDLLARAVRHRVGPCARSPAAGDGLAVRDAPAAEVRVSARHQPTAVPAPGVPMSTNPGYGVRHDDGGYPVEAAPRVPRDAPRLRAVAVLRRPDGEVPGRRPGVG